MSCYGNYSANCLAECPFYKSCEYYTNTPAELRPLSSDCYSLNAVSHDLIGAIEPLSFKYEYISIKKVKEVFQKLASLDDYTLYILKFLITEHETLIEIAKRRNIAKQVLYRKVVRIARTHSWLIPVLQLLFTRKTKIVKKQPIKKV